MSRALYDQIVNGGWAEVEALKGQPEGPNLEAKNKADRTVPKPDDGDRGRIAKAVAGLANADGGVFLFGVRAQRSNEGIDRITNVEPIADVETCLGAVEKVIASGVEPPVTNVHLAKVDAPGETGAGVVVVYVGSSDGGPHRDQTGRYYLRAGSNTAIMPHTILADRFGRRPQPRLRVVADYQQRILIYIRNEGRGVARQPAIVLRPPFDLLDLSSTNTSSGWERFSVRDGIGWSVRTEIVVYPGADTHTIFLSPRGDAVRLQGTVYAADAPPVHFGGDVVKGGGLTLL